MAESSTITHEMIEAGARAYDRDTLRKAGWTEPTIAAMMEGREPSATSVEAAQIILRAAIAPAGEPVSATVSVPAPGTEERDFWLEAAEQHGFEQTSGEEELPAFDPPAYLATEDEVLKLMAAAREQGRKDVLDALATGGAR